MSVFGNVLLGIAFGLTILVAALSIVATLGLRKLSPSADRLAAIARWGSLGITVTLAISCILLVYCFFSGDNSLLYVVEYRSNSTSSLAWFYTLSGLWAGRQGSLLFWGLLISLFSFFVVFRNRKEFEEVDSLALAITALVLVTFEGLLLFSSVNNPFSPAPEQLVDADGTLTAMGALYGLNPLLEHWAMAIHPPTLFTGYAGLTIPFAYALATMILGDDSKTWVNRITGIVRFSWLFLGIGIGLGAVWAYVVLGWGGYWGWDAVENASLLSWISTVALIHSLNIYSRYNTFKRWSVSTACFSFMFVIVGTFISRSGLVQSVHAFEGDPVSLVLFVILIIISFAAGIFGAVGRRKSFALGNEGDADAAFSSREMASFLNNVFLMASAFVLAYFTLASALPSWLPFGGQVIETSVYSAIARPVGLIVCAIIAVCPLLGWHRTNPANFAKHAKIPGICAAVLFALLLVYFFTALLPAYNATIAAGGSIGTALADQGPSWYYNGFAIVAFAVASLLIFNSIFLLVRMISSLNNSSSNLSGMAQFRSRASTFGGIIAHTAMGIILIGLVGSSMYVTEVTGYVASSEDSQADQSLTVQDYTITPMEENSWDAGGDGYMFALNLDITRGGNEVGIITPSIQVDPMTQQQKLNASVVSFPLHDLFVVYRGVNTNGDFSLDVRINPLVSLVWAGFILLMVGTALGLITKKPAASTTATKATTKEAKPSGEAHA